MDYQLKNTKRITLHHQILIKWSFHFCFSFLENMSWSLRRLPGRERTEVDKDEQLTNQDPFPIERPKRRVKRNHPIRFRPDMPEKQLSVRELQLAAEPPRWQNLQLIQPPQPSAPIVLQRPAIQQPFVNDTPYLGRNLPIYTENPPRNGDWTWLNVGPDSRYQIVSRSRPPFEDVLKVDPTTTADL